MRLNNLLYLTLSLVLIGCGEKKDKNQDYNPVIPVEITVANVDNDLDFRNYIGTLQSEMKIALSFPLGGTITEIYVRN